MCYFDSPSDKMLHPTVRSKLSSLSGLLKINTSWVVPLKPTPKMYHQHHVSKDCAIHTELDIFVHVEAICFNSGEYIAIR